MGEDNYILVQKNKNIIAGKLNPAFYQILNNSNKTWFYENFINIVSYDRQGQHIIDFFDNNNYVYENKIQTTHIYSVDKLNCNDFYYLIKESAANNHFINIWCDEYYIPQSVHYFKDHFVHPLTVYSIKDECVCCEFLSIEHGMSLIEVPIENLQKAYYSIKEYYYLGASYDILQTSLSIYKVKERAYRPFDLSVFIRELSCYLYGQVDVYKEKEYCIEGDNFTYGMCYYNDLLCLLKDDNRYNMLPYKCLFDLQLHKIFLLERLNYVRELIGADDEFESYISAYKRVLKIYEIINKLNVKNNLKDGTPRFSISSNAVFREKFINYIEQAFSDESEVISKIVSYLNGVLNQKYKGSLDNFVIKSSENDIILYPRFDDYLTEINISVDKVVDIKNPVKLLLSNGYMYNIDLNISINTYKLRPCKPSWLKISNCISLQSFNIVKLEDQTPCSTICNSLVNWRPLNHIENLQCDESRIDFNIKGNDPYLVCGGFNLDSDKYSYITMEYKTDDIADQGQLYFMTDSSPFYSNEKCLTFNLISSNESYKYKLDLNACPSWNNIVTSFRLDPVHYPSGSGSEHRDSECTIYNISVSQSPPLNSNLEDYAGNQCVNGWEYCKVVDGKLYQLSYNPVNKIWGRKDGAHIGINFQKGVDGTAVSRNWAAPSDGKYSITFNAIQESNTKASVIIDGATIYQSMPNNNVKFQDTLQIRTSSVLQFVTWNGVLRDICIEIKKV